MPVSAAVRRKWPKNKNFRVSVYSHFENSMLKIIPYHNVLVVPLGEQNLQSKVAEQRAHRCSSLAFPLVALDQTSGESQGVQGERPLASLLLRRPALIWQRWISFVA